MKRCNIRRHERVQIQKLHKFHTNHLTATHTQTHAHTLPAHSTVNSSSNKIVKMYIQKIYLYIIIIDSTKCTRKTAVGTCL